MALFTPVLRRTTTSHPPFPQFQSRNATLIRRPKRPYTFTQLVTLSDGSSYLQRTTSPAPIYKSTKDTRNTPLWNPSSQKLLTVEADEAGKLRAFRERFGRGWDASRQSEGQDEDEGIDAVAGQDGTGKEGKGEEREDNLMDLISGYGRETEVKGNATGISQGKVKSGKGKGGEK